MSEEKHDMNSCPHCKNGEIVKSTPNLVCKDGYFICNNCYTTKTPGINEWIRPKRKVLYLDKTTNHPVFDNELNQNKDE